MAVDELLDDLGFYKIFRTYSDKYMDLESSSVCHKTTRAIESLEKPCRFTGADKNACNSYYASNTFLNSVPRVCNSYKPDFEKIDFSEHVATSLVEGIKKYSSNSQTAIRYTNEFFSSLESHAKEFLGSKLNLQVAESDFVGYETQIERFEKRIIPSIIGSNKIKNLGLPGIKCAILHGPPGNGKTSLAKYLSNKNSINLFAYSGGEFMNKWVGESERLIRESYTSAIQKSPAIIFVDEAESCIYDRNLNNSHRNSMTSEWLNTIEGFNSSDKVTVLFATNNIDIIDSAIISRCKNNIIYMPNPSDTDRRKIITKKFSKIKNTITSYEPLINFSNDWSTRNLVGLIEECAWQANDCDRDFVNDKDIVSAVNSYVPLV